MGTELSRLARRGRRPAKWPGLVIRERWGSLLLAGVSLAIGAFFQDPVRYGWLAAAAAGMLLVRVAMTFDPPEAAPPLEPGLPRVALPAYLIGAAGLGAVASLYWLPLDGSLTASWALLGMLLLLLGRGPDQYPLRFVGTVALLLAAGRVIAIDSFPDPMAHPYSLKMGQLFLTARMLRQINFAVVVLAGLASVWLYRPGAGEKPVWNWLALGAHLTALWAITYEIADAIQMTRGAASAGNESLWIATAWGLYGLLLVLTSPWVSPELPWLNLGHAIFIFALGFMLMGGMMANARWADPAVRFAAYAAVPGATLVAAWVQERRGRLTEPDRLLALGAAGMFFGICSFEVARWLEPVMTYPKEIRVTAEMLLRDQNRLNGISMGVWALYSALVIGVGALMHSRLVRFVGGSLLVSVVVYGLFWLVM